MTDYKHIDWNEFSSFYGISTTDNQFQLFVKNYKKQFKSLRSVTFKNPAMTKIYLRDLRKLSKLKFVKFRFRDNLNSNLFNRLTRILESKPELRSYVSIKVDWFIAVCILLILSNFILYIFYFTNIKKKNVSCMYVYF